MYDVLRNNDTEAIVKHVLTHAVPGSSVHAEALPLLSSIYTWQHHR